MIDERTCQGWQVLFSFRRKQGRQQYARGRRPGGIRTSPPAGGASGIGCQMGTQFRRAERRMFVATINSSFNTSAAAAAQLPRRPRAEPTREGGGAIANPERSGGPAKPGRINGEDLDTMEGGHR